MIIRRIPIFTRNFASKLPGKRYACHAVRKEPDILTRQRMIAEIFTSGMYRRMMANVRSKRLSPLGLPAV